MRLTPPVTLLSTALNDTVTKLRERLDTTSQESVTGQYSDLTAHLSGRIGKAMLTQKAMDDLTNERTQLVLKEGRLDIIQNCLTTIHDDVGELSIRMKAALGSGDYTERETVVRDAKAALQETFSVLNTRHGERYLFAGDATATKPFANAETLLDDVRAIAAAAWQVTERVGMPECQLTLAQAAIYMACAPKSNASAMAIWEAMDDVKHQRTVPVPKHLRDGHYAGAKRLGHGAGYKYPHDADIGIVPQQYIPDALRGKRYYEPTSHGHERDIQARLEKIRRILAPGADAGPST